MQVLSRAKVAHSFSFCLNKLLSRRPSLFFPHLNPFLIPFILKRYCLLCRPLLSSSLPDLWLVNMQPMNSFLESPRFEPRLCQVWGTLREIQPKERQPFLQVLIFPEKTNQEHWRSCENPIIHWIINCGRTMVVKAKKSQHQCCQLSLLSNLQTYCIARTASDFTFVPVLLERLKALFIIFIPLVF